MALISVGQMFSNPKRRPKSYKARDAAYAVGGKKGLYIAALPRPYPKTRQQQKVKDVAANCGIKKGISKADLMNKMKDCVGPAMKK